MRGDIELMGVPPPEKILPGMAVFGRSAAVSPSFKKQLCKELQTPFLIENNNKNNRKIEKKTIENWTLFSKTSSIKGRTLRQNVE